MPTSFPPSDQPRILPVITARGGSKGVPYKNLRTLGGRPLIAWSIATALALGNRLHRVVVSTDDPEIAAAARAHGADVPFLRPAELATDEARSLPVLQHATSVIEARDGVCFDWVLLLQPTTPLRTTADLASCLDLAQVGDCDSVISVTRLHSHPVFAKIIDEAGYLQPFSLPEPEGLRRQDAQPPTYIRNGAVYLTRRDILMNENSIWGQRIRAYEMPEERSVNIDTETDFLIAAARVAAAG